MILTSDVISLLWRRSVYDIDDVADFAVHVAVKGIDGRIIYPQIMSHLSPIDTSGKLNYYLCLKKVLIFGLFFRISRDEFVLIDALIVKVRTRALGVHSDNDCVVSYC